MFSGGIKWEHWPEIKQTESYRAVLVALVAFLVIRRTASIVFLIIGGCSGEIFLVDFDKVFLH